MFNGRQWRSSIINSLPGPQELAYVGTLHQYIYKLLEKGKLSTTHWVDTVRKSEQNCSLRDFFTEALCTTRR